MDLKEIAHISGKAGLHRILKPTRNGVIAESLDEKKTKQVIGIQNRVSVLKEISIYTNTEEGAQPLGTVLEKIYALYKDEIPVSAEDSSEELSDFLETILPEYDKTRVYTSDIKRLVTWYGLLRKNAPELFDIPTETPQEEAPLSKTNEADNAAEEPPGNPAALQVDGEDE